jgi:hypothetical protein
MERTQPVLPELCVDRDTLIIVIITNTSSMS